MWQIMKDNVEDLLSPNLWRSLACEVLGTMAIVLLGCGAWIPWGGAVNVVQVALAFGLAVATMVWCFAHISGAHFNPAVTAGALVTRRVSIVRGVLYLMAQVVGGVLGAGILYGLTPALLRDNLGATIVTPSVTSAQAFGVEALITLVYVLAFFASRDQARTDLAGSSPLTIGLAVVVCQLFAIGYTRAGMNSARSFGPAVIMGVWEHHWVYWVGPLTGGVVAGLLYDYVFSAGATVAKASKCLLRTKRPPTTPSSEKPPLDDGPAPEVIEIDETAADAKDANNKEAGDAKIEVEETNADSDKTKLADDSAAKETA